MPTATDPIPFILSGMLVGGAIVSLGLLMQGQGKANPIPTVGLAAVFVILAMAEIADGFGMFGRSNLLDISLIPVVRASAFLIAPFIFAHVRLVFGHRWKTLDGIHLVPAILVWMAFVYSEAVGPQGPGLSQLSWMLFILQTLAYMGAVAWTLQNRMAGLRDLFSTLPPGSVARVRRLWMILLVPIAGLSVELVLNGINVLSPALMVAGAAVRTFSVLCVLVLLVSDQIAPSEPEETLTAAPRYARSALDEATSLAFAERIRDHMEAVKPYRDPLLTLATLARQLRMSEHHLSQSLNRSFGANFYDFINKYRIAEAKQLLEETNETILNISLDVGFNSRSTFYQAFKKHAGRKPTELRGGRPEPDLGGGRERQRQRATHQARPTSDGPDHIP